MRIVGSEITLQRRELFINPKIMITKISLSYHSIANEIELFPKGEEGVGLQYCGKNESHGSLKDKIVKIHHPPSYPHLNHYRHRPSLIFVLPPPSFYSHQTSPSLHLSSQRMFPRRISLPPPNYQ